MPEYYHYTYREMNDEWRECMPRIPSVPARDGWRIRPLPPFGGMIARFSVEDGEGGHVSIYLDFFGRAGAVDRPYWELYPNAENGDCWRAFLGEEDELAEEIEASLQRQRADREQPTAARTGGQEDG